MSTSAANRSSGCHLGLAALIAWASVAANGTAWAQEPSEGGSWQPRHYQFQYLSDNTTYACGGLTDKVRLLLRTLSARDVQVTPICLGNPGLPDQFAQVDLKFQSLMPAAVAAAGDSATSAAGRWQHVQWAPSHPVTLGPGDCSLIEQLLRTLLPMVATRNLKTRFDCQEHHDYGPFSVSFDVFAPSEPAR